MEIFDNFLEYRKHLPKYENWKQQRENKEAKRLSYIKNHNMNEAQKKQDIERAKAVLNAVDIMDEYSQTRAEDTEILVQGVTQTASQLITYPLMGLGFLAAFTKPIQAKYGQKAFIILPLLASALGGLITYPFLAQWGAKKEVEASRTGRFEAMQKDLASVKQFAVLDEQQKQQIDKIYKNIEINPKEAKKLNKADKNGFSIIKSLKLLFGEKDDELTKVRENFKEKLENDESKFNTVVLGENDIEEAKKDQQLIQNIVEKIDIASQDYAENIELATSAVEAVGFGSGGLVGAGIYKLLKKTKIPQTKQPIIAVVTGFLVALALTFKAATLQKQGSRVARFKVKQDFLNNPERLIYVDDKKAENELVTDKKDKKKQGFFRFLIQVFKDNKEYNEYLKENSVIQKQKSKAREEITLTPEQEKRARQLQQNTFKMFNKLDDKSQKYAEHTEATGEIIANGAGIIASAFAVLGAKGILKSNMESTTEIFRTMAPMYKRLLFIAPLMIILNAIITKEQKQASRVANMLAIDEMSDYRHFADYSNKTVQTDTKKVNAKNNDVFAKFRKKN